MIRKIIFLIFIIFLAIFISNALNYNDEIIINVLDYEITTTTSLLLFLLIGVCLVFYLLVYLSILVFYPNSSNYKKNEKKLNKKISQYIELITEAFIYKSVRNSREALKKLRKADKVYKETNLSKLLESQIYYIEKEYEKSENSFKKINNANLNIDLLNLKINLEQSKKVNSIENIEKYATKILKIEPVNSDCLKALLEIYMNKKEWEKANNVLQIGIKAKVFKGEKYKNEMMFVYTALGKKYYETNNLPIAKKVLREAYRIDNNFTPNLILLIQTYISMGKSNKAIYIIKKIWKYNTNPKIAELYFSLMPEKERKSIKIAETLYKLNNKSFESNYILAKAYFNQELYSKARKYAKIAENINSTKDIYELMLKIEQEDNGSSATIANLKNKILNAKNSVWECDLCKKEYQDWQVECSNCKNLNKINWKI